MMMPRPERSRLGPILLILVAFSLTGIVGCQDIDWNWDMNWWNKPKRMVRPSRKTKNRSVSPQKKPPASAQQPAENKNATTGSSQKPPAKPQPTPTQNPASHQTKTLPPANLPHQTKPPTQPANPPKPKPTITGQHQNRPYYQLYLVSKGHTGEENRGTESITLVHTTARLCASLVELLYIPLGRSGNPDECYLLFEEVDEFQAVVAMVPMMDRPTLDTAPKTIGAKTAFEAGISVFLSIVQQGIEVEPAAVAACERLFAEAVQSNQLTAGERWAAGILAGRVVSEYRYDFASAASYYRQALQHAAPDSLEEMTGRWWQADAYTQQGLNKEARSEYRTIIRTFEDKWPLSHIVRRSRTILKKTEK